MPYKNYKKSLEYNRNWIKKYRAALKAETERIAELTKKQGLTPSKEWIANAAKVNLKNKNKGV